MNGVHVAGGFAVASSLLLIIANVSVLLYHSVTGTDYDGEMHFGAIVVAAIMGVVGMLALGA